MFLASVSEKMGSEVQEILLSENKYNDDQLGGSIF